MKFKTSSEILNRSHVDYSDSTSAIYVTAHIGELESEAFTDTLPLNYQFTPNKNVLIRRVTFNFSNPVSETISIYTVDSNGNKMLTLQKTLDNNSSVIASPTNEYIIYSRLGDYLSIECTGTTTEVDVSIFTEVIG